MFVGHDNEPGAIDKHTRVSCPLLAAGLVERATLSLRKVCSAGPGGEQMLSLSTVTEGGREDPEDGKV